MHLDPDAVRVAGLGSVSIGVVGRSSSVNGPIEDVDDLTREVEEGPVPPEKLPLVE